MRRSCSAIAIPLALLALALGACTTGPDSYGDPLDDPQLPARGAVDVQVWLAAGYYQAWHCEPSPHPARSPSPHGINRICSNDALYNANDADGTGPYPVGAAAVKELYDGDRIALYSVYRKVDPGAGGDTWYWYEGRRGAPSTNGEGDSTCTGCHGRAPRDFVYTVPR